MSLDRSDAVFEAEELAASITASDLAVSLAWYRDVMGFRVDRRFEPAGVLRAVSLAAGRARLLLTQDDGAKGAGRLKGQGISLQLTTAQDIDRFAAAIKARGGTLESEPTDTPWGVRMFRLRDPDGFRFTIASPPPRNVDP